MGKGRVLLWLMRVSLICVTIVGLIGCGQSATSRYNRYEGTGGDAAYFSLAQKYYNQGDHQRSLDQSLSLISQYPKSAFYDKALFYAALNKLHLADPGVSHEEVAVYFRQLVKECPNSPLRAESNAWIAVLSSLSLKDKEIIELKEELEEKETTISLFLEEKEESLQKLRKEMEKKIKNLQSKKDQEITKLKKELDLLKKVDFQLEQKKKVINKKREKPKG